MRGAEIAERDDELSLSRRVIAGAVVATLLLSILAVFLQASVRPAVERSFWCHARIGDVVLLLGVAAIFGAFAIVVVALRRASRNGLLFALPAVALFAVGIVLLRLFGDTWGSPSCHD